MPTNPPSERPSEDSSENLPENFLEPSSEESPSLPPDDDPNEPPEIETARTLTRFRQGTLVELGLAAWGWLYVQEDLSPQISKTLTNFLERPVDLGDVENVTFGSVTLGPSVIGASETDSTTLTAEGVIVEFDLLETIFQSKIGLDITVIEPEGYLAQDADKGWLNVDIPEREPPEEPNRFDISVDDVRFREGELTLVPLPAGDEDAEPIFLQQVAGSLSAEKVVVAERDSLNFRFEVSGEPENGGDITLKGEVQPVAPVLSGETSVEDAPESDGFATDEDDRPKPDWATNLFIQADEAPLADVLEFTLASIKINADDVDIESGAVSGMMDMAFRPGEDIDYSGTISAEDATIQTALLPLPIKNAAGQTQFQGNLWTIDRLSADYGAIENVVAEGLIDFDNGYELEATKSTVSVDAFVNTIDLDLPVPTEGVFDAIAFVSGPIANPQFSGSVNAVTPVDVDRVTFDTASSDFFLQGAQLSLDNIALTPTTGGSVTGSGQVRLSDGSPFTFQLAGRSLPAQQLANLYDINPNFTLGLVSADATVVGNGGNVTTTVDWDAPNAQYPGSGAVDIVGTNLAFRDTVFAIGGGTVSGGGSLIGQAWDADVTFQNVQLTAFSEDLRGDVNGQFQFNGTTADTRIGAITAAGNITFSDGLSAFSPQFDNFNSPLDAQVAWNGEQIEVIRASSNRVTASGTLTPSFDEGFTGLDSFDLNVAADDYALAELPFDIPDIIALSGLGDVGGRLTGSPSAPSFTGNVQLSNLVVNNLPFNPFLAGTVAYSPNAGLALDVDGDTDSIALNVGPFEANSDTIPALDFNIGWQGAIAQGQTQGNILTGSARDFPLAALNFPAGGAADIGQLRGTLSSNSFTADLANQTLNGDIDIDQLGVGYIGAGKLTGQINYANSLATLANGTLVVNENLYTLTGNLALGGPAPVYSADLNTQKGNVQNLLSTLSIYRLDDFRRGLTPPEWLQDPLSPEDLDVLLATFSAGETLSGKPYNLNEQLNRLAEVEELETDRAIAEAAEPLPPLRELNGPFAGNIKLTGTGSDFQVNFDLTGQQWRWGEDYSAQEVVATGTLTPNVLVLEPVRFSSAIIVPAEPVANDDIENPIQPAESVINLAGQIVFGRDTELNSDLQATAQNINITTFSDIFQIPIDVEGRANALATLGGTIANPQLRGSADLEAAFINDAPIEAANARFLYRNARLLLSSTLTTSTPEEPLRLEAQIPYAFNFMDVQPDSEDIDITIDVRNEGLALLNIFSRQVAWDSGEGQVNLSIGGTLSEPEIAGKALVNNAVINAQILPEPLTNVNGSATFVDDQIVVKSLQGRFSDGQLTAAGIFPLRSSILSGPELAALSPNSSQSISQSSPEASGPSLEEAEASSPDPAELPTDTNILTAPEATAVPENPFFQRPLAENLPLTVNLENIALTLEDLYSGSVNGQIVVGGNALGEGPQVGGQVFLSDGQVLLPSGNGAEENIEDENLDPVLVTDNSDGADPGNLDLALGQAKADVEAPNAGLQPVFRNLQLTLGDSIRIVQGNLLNFAADGTLLLNGSPTALEPDGTINLRSGRVSLFTTLFSLRGRNNIARFTPESGLQNPFLDVSLRASVPEVDSPGPISSTPFAQADVIDNSDIGFETAGSLQTIRVRANVEGPANAIFENLELSSSPPRSQNELIGLIGGGFVTALESTFDSLSGGGDDFGGLINLVSSTLLTSVQDFVSRALSLSEFRLFPVTTASRASSENNTGTGLDIGAEIGFDVTEDATLSIIKVLTDNTNPEFGVNYRLTDSLNLRTNTNLDDINQVLLEYEIRF